VTVTDIRIASLDKSFLLELEQFHEIAGWILHKAGAASAGLADLTFEFDPGFTEAVDQFVDIIGDLTEAIVGPDMASSQPALLHADDCPYRRDAVLTNEIPALQFQPTHRTSYSCHRTDELGRNAEVLEYDARSTNHAMLLGSLYLLIVGVGRSSLNELIWR
jgi:hypothetical protein